MGGVGLAAAGGAVLGTAAVVGGLNVAGFGAGGVVGGISDKILTIFTSSDIQPIL